jgi:hypothetical protein
MAPKIQHIRFANFARVRQNSTLLHLSRLAKRTLSFMSTATRDSNIGQLIDALLNGMHWSQVAMHEKGKRKGDASVFGRGNMSLEKVDELANTAETLLKLPSEKIVAWADGKTDDAGVAAKLAALKAAPFSPSPKLPAYIVLAAMKKKLGNRDELSGRAVANLLQLNLQENRDGDLLQDMFRIYVALGLKVNFVQLDLPHADADFIAWGKKFAEQSALAPYRTDAAYWHLSLCRIEMWGEKNTGRRDKYVMAKELLRDPEIEPLIPALKAMPAKRCAFVGFSMLMNLHWSSYGSWNDMACETVRLVNPKLEYAGFQTGGINATQALKTLLPGAMAYKPDETYLLMVVDTDEHEKNFETMLHELKKAGSKVFVLDENRPWLDRVVPITFQDMYRRRCAAAKAGAEVLDFYALGRTAPDWPAWECLDTIHMNTPGHVFYAKQLLKRWAKQK